MAQKKVEVLVRPDGTFEYIHDDDFTAALKAAGGVDLTPRRASHVEPNPDCTWSADLSPVGGPVLGPFERRDDALAAEVLWLRVNYLKSRPELRAIRDLDRGPFAVRLDDDTVVAFVSRDGNILLGGEFEGMYLDRAKGPRFSVRVPEAEEYAVLSIRYCGIGIDLGRHAKVGELMDWMKEVNEHLEGR